MAIGYYLFSIFNEAGQFLDIGESVALIVILERSKGSLVRHEINKALLETSAEIHSARCFHPQGTNIHAFSIFRGTGQILDMGESVRILLNHCKAMIVILERSEGSLVRHEISLVLSENICA